MKYSKLTFNDLFARIEFRTSDLNICYYEIPSFLSNRTNLPALFSLSGRIKWANDETDINRMGGPAITNITGTMEYLLNGIFVSNFEVMI